MVEGEVKEGVARTDELLFVLVTGDALHLVDIGTHKSFGDVRLAEIMHRNFPAATAATPFVAIGSASRDPGPPLTAKERLDARESGVQAPVIIDGQAFFPLGGIATSGDNVRAVSAGDNLHGHEFLSTTACEPLPPRCRTSRSRSSIFDPLHWRVSRSTRTRAYFGAAFSSCRIRQPRSCR